MYTGAGAASPSDSQYGAGGTNLGGFCSEAEYDERMQKSECERGAHLDVEGAACRAPLRVQC